MTENQKTRIAGLRAKGLGYGKIAKELDLPVNRVKSYCRRNALGGIAAAETPAKAQSGEITHFENCGKVIHQIAKQKPKRFCCDKCRNQWWNSHLDQVKRKAVHRYTCPNCGREFEVYGNRPRKYCCHACYVEHRFGGKSHE